MNEHGGKGTLYFTVLLISVVVLFAMPTWAQSGATLLVNTNLDCTWKLDGKPQGTLKAGEQKTVSLMKGKHQLEAVPDDGDVIFMQKFTQSEAEQVLVEITLKDQYLWTDPTTGLMWTKTSNSSDVTLKQATDYCGDLRLGGYSDWRLASIDELAGIFHPSQRSLNCYIKGNIRLRSPLGCMVWSSSPGSASGQAWFFGFSVYKTAYEPKQSGPVDKGLWKRAVCVRRAAE
jgi:hypothetical protein